MLKKLSFLAAILIMLGALPAAAQSRCNNAGGGNLAWLFALPPEPAAAAAPAAPSTIVFASTAGKPGAGTEATCMVTEDCDGLPDISCSGQTCSAVSRNCSLGGCDRGHVTCNGVTTYCSQVCPPNCTMIQCRQACAQPGCFATCLDTCTCECETICH